MSKPVEDSATVDAHLFYGLLKLVEQCHNAAAAKGFWNEAPNVSEKLMLIVTELAEGCEAMRNRNPPSEHIPDFSSLEEELADAVIRIADLSGGLGVRLASAIVAKLAFNQTRPHKHNKEF